ncbi:hypothetical protein HanHA300_Chr08g0291311 [Helianthus annuus]|nr:hypothetical protein HanHA300_Chr08g0291311 [Helianthus annuus]
MYDNIFVAAFFYNVVATTEGGCMSLYASFIIITLLKPTLFAFYCWK